METMKNLRVGIFNLLGGLLSVLILLFLGGFGIGTSKLPPDNAVILFNDEAKTYSIPPCVEKGLPYREGTRKELNDKDYRKVGCKNDDFSMLQEGRSLSGKLLERIGFLPPLPSRWNEDGSWNW
ncbi:MAG: hypothetical protein R2747_18840 [Pyrinomonadaceae bacterium]